MLLSTLDTQRYIENYDRALCIAWMFALHDLDEDNFAYLEDFDATIAPWDLKRQHKHVFKARQRAYTNDKWDHDTYWGYYGDAAGPDIRNYKCNCFLCDPIDVNEMRWVILQEQQDFANKGFTWIYTRNSVIIMEKRDESTCLDDAEEFVLKIKPTNKLARYL